MSKKMKKSISVILTIAMLVSLFSVVGSAVKDEGYVCDCGKNPIIYVFGKQPIVDEEGKDVLDESGDDIAKAATAISASLGTGIATDDWEGYCDTVYEEIKPFYDEYALDKDGNVTNGTHVNFSWSADEINDIHKSSWAKAFVYKYDCRLDPCEIAEDLNNYVEAIKRETGHSKVSFIGRCLGSNIVCAYLAQYQADKNYSGIESVVLYSPAVMGVDLVSQLFCGKVKVDASAIGSYSKDVAAASDDIESESWLELINAAIDLIYASGVGSGVTDYTNEIVARLYENTIPRLVRDTFATLPGYWSMVGDEYYEQAKAFIFGDREEEYANLINKIDNYHNNVQLKATDMLLDMDSKGVKIGVFAKYGYQLKPIVEECDRLGDNTVSVVYQSLGATASTVNGTLSDEYIAGRDAIYISPDKKIDASTCLFPNRTWFIKNLEHSVFPDSPDELAYSICRAKEPVTVDTYKQFPQFMKWTLEEGVTPLTKDDAGNAHDNTDDYSGDGDIEEVKQAGIKMLFNMIKVAFIELLNAIKKLFEG